MYSRYTLETILATAFGRKVEVQKGEASLLAESAANMCKGVGDLAHLLHLILSKLRGAPSSLSHSSSYSLFQVSFPGWIQY